MGFGKSHGYLEKSHSNGSAENRILPHAGNPPTATDTPAGESPAFCLWGRHIVETGTIGTRNSKICAVPIRNRLSKPSRLSGSGELLSKRFLCKRADCKRRMAV